MKAAAGRFEQSFVFHMIRDFFLLLIAVAAIELGIRYAVLLYEFRTAEPARVKNAAEQLAADIKSIMLNSGGPLAAQTVYPILNRNYDDLGLSIAVEPSEVTVESMKESFKMDPQGLKPRWPSGPLVKLKARFDDVTRALERAAPPVRVAEAQSAEYQAFAQSLREMAVLEAQMQSVAASGQQVLQRLAAGRGTGSAEPSA